MEHGWKSMDGTLDVPIEKEREMKKMGKLRRLNVTAYLWFCPYSKNYMWEITFQDSKRNSIIHINRNGPFATAQEYSSKGLAIRAIRRTVAQLGLRLIEIK